MMISRLAIFIIVTWSAIVYAHNNDFEVTPTSIRSTFFLHVVNYSQWQQRFTSLKFCSMEQAPQQHYQILQKSDLVTKNNLKIDLQLVNTFSDAIEQRCNYIFIDKSQESKLLYKDLKQTSLSIVTIGETIAFLRNGGLVSLIEENGKIKIYINKQQYANSPVKFSARLLKYANFTG
ncbi:YfiR family protein [Aliiglaciecola sp. 3_MG-2023]|uniref:YfiR family protein n=1 Tax=Aliiglaciecola sp. 3_MG-2023 TaxID=3062644 RepID=UPI0026E19DFE|nr:YfiR family protein [Aliiglaciecola sp. 3_MG-2023]MDO6695803.1 YfiR family protein [Aliiglaciecola sp. 3_MG-2023]